MTDAQAQYLDEVLGAWPMAESSPAEVEVAVLTPRLSDEESALLKKILASIQLKNFVHVTSGEAEAPNSRHILNFGVDGVESEWNFPPLNEMTGSGEQVQAQKKLTWSLLQQFQKQLRG